MSKPRLEGKVALITGAASGIGEEAVRLFSENGAIVVGADVQDELGQKVIQSLNLTDKLASYYHCDVRDEKQVEQTVKFTVTKYGKIDILFSNAGILGPILNGILDLEIQAFDDTMATNVRGVAATIKHAARAMVEKKTRGSIICTASVASSVGGTGPHAYTVSKHAVLGLVRTACSELEAFGIRVNCVSPSGLATRLAGNGYGLDADQIEADRIKTEQFEANMSRVSNLKGVVLKARHVAEAALFLASDESCYISGHNLAVDGGLTAVNNIYSDVVN